MRSSLTCTVALCLLTLSVSPARSGEIPGLPPLLLPTIDRDFALSFSNDFLGRGGSVDDFRTQQIIISAKFNENWFALVDHSILTLTDSPMPGRTDQLSASLGYRLFESDRNIVAVGGGLRSTGEFEGERMQNGFHRLIGSDIDSLPYVEPTSTDATAWIDVNRYVRFGTIGNWAAAYWLRAGSLVTTDGQWDSTLSALATLNRNNTEIWFGLRQDWRSGYGSNNVLFETAREEEDTAVVLGMRFGALVIETVQQLNNDSSYGQIKLVSSGVRSKNTVRPPSKIAIDFGFLVPDIELQLAGRMKSRITTGSTSVWDESVFVDMRYGKPQYGSDDTLYTDSWQLSVGLEWTRPVFPNVNWLSVYGSLGAGWRSEQLIREAPGTSDKSDSTGQLVFTGSTGLRVFATTLGDNWNYRLQLGVNVTTPVSDESVSLANEQFVLQKTSLGLFLGMTFDRR